MATTFDDPEPFGGEGYEPYITQMHPSLRLRLHEVAEKIDVSPHRVIEDALMTHLLLLEMGES